MQHLQRKQHTPDPPAPIWSTIETRPWSDLSAQPQQSGAPVTQYKFHIGNMRILRPSDEEIKSPHQPPTASSPSSEQSPVARRQPSPSAIQTRPSSDRSAQSQQYRAPVTQYKFHIGNMHILRPSDEESKSPHQPPTSSSPSSEQSQVAQRRPSSGADDDAFEDVLNDDEPKNVSQPPSDRSEQKDPPKIPPDNYEQEETQPYYSEEDEYVSMLSLIDDYDEQEGMRSLLLDYDGIEEQEPLSARYWDRDWRKDAHPIDWQKVVDKYQRKQGSPQKSEDPMSAFNEWRGHGYNKLSKDDTDG
jgi:hypothetical protein